MEKIIIMKKLKNFKDSEICQIESLDYVLNKSPTVIYFLGTTKVDIKVKSHDFSYFPLSNTGSTGNYHEYMSWYYLLSVHQDRDG